MNETKALFGLQNNELYGYPYQDKEWGKLINLKKNVNMARVFHEV